MLSIFKKQYSNLAVILISSVLIILHVILSYNQITPIEVWQSEAPLSNWLVLSIPNLIQRPLFTFTSSLIIIALQSYLVYRIADSVRQIDEFSLLFTWMYVWIIHAFPELHMLSPHLISSTFLLLAIYSFLKNINQTNSNTHYFYIGFFIGLASLFLFSSVLTFALFIIIQFMYNVIKLKTGLIIGLSALVILLDFYFFQFFTNNILTFGEDLKRFSIQTPALKPLSYWQAIPSILLILLVTLGVVNSFSLSNKINQSARLFLNFTLVLLITMSFGIFLNNSSLIYAFTPVLFSLSVYLSLTLNIFKRPLFNELMHIVVILCILTNQYLYSI